ncbi:MAG TPA: hypothetical protein VFP97_00460 [Chitinophagaceae bacterium]|nr:hypothetical protein [Chitinophagaceae bacterium]
MNTMLELKQDRVRKHTADKVNQKIDKCTEENIQRYSNESRDVVRNRIEKLNQELDVEQALQLTSAANVLVGIGLALTVNKKWLLLSAISSAFLIQHSLQGWCPPLPVFRRLGVRTRDEINEEIDALKERLNTYSSDRD